MSPLRPFTAAFVLVALAIAAPAPAFLVDRGVLTHDARTGKAWLDLTLTTDISFNSMAAMLGPSQEFDGFRHAESDEVLELFESAGIDGAPFSQVNKTQEEIAPIRSLQELVGITIEAGIPGSFDRPVSNGISKTVSQFDSTSVLIPFLEIIDRPGEDFDMASAGLSSTGKSESFSSVGHWLVSVGFLPGYRSEEPLGATSESGDTFGFEAADGAGLWFSGSVAEGFDYATVDEVSKFLTVAIDSTDENARYTVSDDSNGVREVAAGEFLEFAVPVDRFAVRPVELGRAERGAETPPFIAATFLRFDQESVDFETVRVGQVFDPCIEIDCDDGNPCTEDRCDGAGLCRHEASSTAVCGAEAARLCSVRFAVTDEGTINSLEIRVDYDREMGSFADGSAACEALTDSGQWSFDSSRAAERLEATLTTKTPLATPADLIVCDYATVSDPVLAEDFLISVGPFFRFGDSGPANVEVSAIDCHGCGTPVSGAASPAASDCLFVLRAAVGSSPCALCVCDVSGNADIAATDALICLRRAVGQDLDLQCPPCGASAGN